MTHPIQCQCGTVRAQLHGSGTYNRIACYCTDCRAFARFLGGDAILDKQGGTQIVQVAQARLRFTHGLDHLAVMRLSEKGLMRWYASCCNTPIGNTLDTPSISFIGLIHSCMDAKQLDARFGSKITNVNTQSALGIPKPNPEGLGKVVLRFLAITGIALANGSYKKSVLFKVNGQAIAKPRVLTTTELGYLKSADTPANTHMQATRLMERWYQRLACR